MSKQSPAATGQPAGPLAGLRVVEMTIAIQGPGAGVFLRDMGAEVIKIEPPVGDPSRYHRGANNTFPDDVMGPQYIAMNRGKRSVCIDANSEAGKEAVVTLLSDADVFLCNYRQPALDRMGLGYETLRALNPRLIYAIANGFGPRGDDANKVMLDGAAIARGGLASLTGTQELGPMAPGAAVADTAGAMQLALAVVTALFARENTGQGQRVRTSALGAQLWLQQWELTHTWMTDTRLARCGAHHPNIRAPYGIYETADHQHFLFAVANNDETWDAFWVFVGEPEEALNPMWDSRGKRLGTGATEEGALAIQQKMRRVFKTKTAAQWQEFLGAHDDIVYERVRDYFDVRDDPQNAANNYIEEFDVPDVGSLALVGNLIDFSETPASTRGGPPRLGADTRAVLGDAGFSADAIDAMIEHATNERAAALELVFGKPPRSER